MISANSAKDLFFGSKKISESYTMDDYEIINDSIIKIINYDESKKSVVDEKIILINKNSNIHNNVHQIERFIIEKKFIFGVLYLKSIFFFEFTRCCIALEALITSLLTSMVTFEQILAK